MKPLAEIVELARTGDSGAFAAIVERFRENALGRAYAVLGDFQLAQDAVQEAFTEAFLNLDKLRDPAAFPGWFKRIVVKRIDRLIRGKRLETTSLDTAYHVPGELPDVAEDLDFADAADLLLDAVAHLPERELEAVRLYYLDEVPQRETARALGAPSGTIKKRLFTSRRRLREALEGAFDDSAPDRFGLEAQLFAAAWKGYVTKAEALLRHDPALVRTENEDGLGILLYAAHASHHSGNTRVADLLVSRGAPIDVFSAAALNMTQVVDSHLRANPAAVTQSGPWGRAALHWAASGGHLGLIESLLRRGADVNAPDHWRCTPLHLAAELGRLEAVEALCKSGADIHARLTNGKTPLHVAAQGGHFSVVEALLKRNARVDIFTAASLGWIDRAQRLIARNPELLLRRLAYGATALHIAAESGRVEMAQYLVERGAPLDVVSATELGWKDEVRALLEASPQVVAAKAGSFGFTPLHSATAKGRRDVARILLAHGAPVNATDEMYRKTPLGEALYYGNEAMARLLYKHGAASSQG